MADTEGNEQVGIWGFPQIVQKPGLVLGHIPSRPKVTALLLPVVIIGSETGQGHVDCYGRPARSLGM